MSELGGYQPRPAVAALARVQARGPVSRELRERIDRWLKARERERELQAQLGKARRELGAARTQRQVAYAEDEAAQLDSRPVDEKRLAELEQRVESAERAFKRAEDRLVGFRDLLVEREREVDHYAQRHSPELSAEMIAPLAKAEAQFRETLTAVQRAVEAMDDAVFVIDAVQATVQGAERVWPASGGLAGELVSIVGRLAGAPLVGLPEALRPLAEELGIVVTIDDGGRLIPANVRGPVNMNERHAAQVERMEQLAAAEGVN